MADTNPKQLLYASVGSNETRVIADSPALAFMEGSRVSFVSVPNFPAGDIVVWDTSTDKRASYFHFDSGAQSGDLVGTMLSDKYLYWMSLGVTSRANLVTGVVLPQFFGPLSCDGGCAMGGSLFCLNNDRVQVIDEETSASRPLDDGHALQLNGGCSPDRRRFVWVDFRDPPGQDSSFFGARTGGEIYLYDAAISAVRRLTHDSPNSPVTKGYAAVGSDLVVWVEPCAACPKSFPGDSAFQDGQFALVRLELNANRKCRLEGRGIGGYASIHEHHLYSYWNDGSDMYLVDLDLDYPGLAWGCE